MTKSHTSVKFCSRRTDKQRLVGLMLIVYMALLLQPCASAMGSEPDQHRQDCHGESLKSGDIACLSQPSLDCATDDVIAGVNDFWKSDFSAHQVALIPAVAVNPVAGIISSSIYFSRAPPAGEPPLNVRYCVFLK